MKANVEHPPHYGGDGAHEVWNCLDAWGLQRNANLYNVGKYIARADKKHDGLEDLKKARAYLEREIRRREAGA